MNETLTPAHRGGAGSPLVCLHGFTDTWRTWELVLPVLERYHDVYAPTLPGHTEFITTNYEHIPGALIAHQVQGVARCAAVQPMIAAVLANGWTLDAERIRCPVRFIWGTADRLLPWPSAATRYRDDWLPNAEWVELEGVGHCPQLDVPLETAELIAGFTAR